MTPGVVPHAITRALERYGLKINYSDLFEMCQQCKVGYGRLTYLPDGKERHLVSCQGKVMVAIYAPPDVSHIPQGRIITILPQSEAMPKARGSPATKYRARRARPSVKLPKKNRQRKGY